MLSFRQQESFLLSADAILRSLVELIVKHRLARRAISIFLLPFELILTVPLYLVRIRALRISVLGRIGHLATEPDIYLKVRMLGLRRWKFGIIICPPGAAANECLLEYWGRHIRVVRYPFWSRILARLYRHPHLSYDVSRYYMGMNETAPFIAVKRAWSTRPALLTLTEKHRRDGRAKLVEMGVPADADLICFHCREGSYSPSDEEWHSFRNSSIENYLPAVIELTKRGFWCIRMGDPTMRRIPPTERVIDYPHLDARSDWMDIFLCGSCKFFLGSASGLVQVAGVFGTPSGAANQAPFSHALQFGLKDVAIPKLMWSETQERYLTFREIFGSDVANFRFTALFEKQRIRPVENTPEEVRDLALEMLERSAGRATYTQEDEELQQRFKALMRPGHYSYGGISRIGRDFLRKYAHLLGDRQG